MHKHLQSARNIISSQLTIIIRDLKLSIGKSVSLIKLRMFEAFSLDYITKETRLFLAIDFTKSTLGKISQKDLRLARRFRTYSTAKYWHFHSYADKNCISRPFVAVVSHDAQLKQPRNKDETKDREIYCHACVSAERYDRFVSLDACKQLQTQV